MHLVKTAHDNREGMTKVKHCKQNRYNKHMAYLVLAYPDIEQSDYDWVQGIRKNHDKRYFDVVKPHFTLVFSTNKLSLEDFTQHVNEKIKAFRVFDIILDSVRVVEDDSKQFFHQFLVPSKGFDEINTIHDALYTGPLESELRHDIPFIPHVGIGTSDDIEEAEKVVRMVEQSQRTIIGTISTITIIEFDGKKVTDLQTIHLNK